MSRKKRYAKYQHEGCGGELRHVATGLTCMRCAVIVIDAHEAQMPIRREPLPVKMGDGVWRQPREGFATW